MKKLIAALLICSLWRISTYASEDRSKQISVNPYKKKNINGNSLNFEPVNTEAKKIQFYYSLSGALDSIQFIYEYFNLVYMATRIFGFWWPLCVSKFSKMVLESAFQFSRRV